MATLALYGIGHSWDGGRTWAVRRMDIGVDAGELVALVGESGCGKSTALRTINRLVTPTEGSVHIDGADISTADVVALRRSIGTVFQHIALFPHLTIAENIAVVPRLLGWQASRIDARVDALLDIMKLPQGAAQRYPSQLSGGQRQRVGLARALAARPRILLMDEPFGALDPVTRTELQTEVRAIHDELDLATLLVTHDMTEALAMADRIAVMHSGELIRIGTPREVLNDPRHPVVAALMDAPRRHAAIVEELAGA